MRPCAKTWAEQEFGHAKLGDQRRTKRLISLAAEACEHPAGTVNAACRTSASREGAFRWLESSAVKVQDVVEAAAIAGARRCAGYPRVIVAVDGSSLSIAQHPRGRGLGAVGSRKQGQRGVHVLTALAMAPDGTTLGLCGQTYWSRERPSSASQRRRRRVGEQTETRHWGEMFEAVQSHMGDAAPECTPWFQIDRGADCWEVLTAAATSPSMWVTVRATHDRRLDEPGQSLWQKLQKAPIRASRQVDVPARPPQRKRQRIGGRRYQHWLAPAQPPRRARVDIRAARVKIDLSQCSGRRGHAELNAVWVHERNRRGDALEWMLLTSHPIATRRDVLAIVDAYALRWRVEEFHRTWKSGLCRVEDTQLRSSAAVFKWAAVLASVAIRAMALSRVARSTPDVPATDHLTPRELQAIFALRQPKGADPNLVPTLAQAVRWIADLGGYVGPWNGPAGPKVIGRGLHDVLVVARALEGREKM